MPSLPNRHLSSVMSEIPSWSVRNECSTAKGLALEGRPRTRRFNSRVRFTRSSSIFPWTNFSTLERGATTTILHKEAQVFTLSSVFVYREEFLSTIFDCFSLIVSSSLSCSITKFKSDLRPTVLVIRNYIVSQRVWFSASNLFNWSHSLRESEEDVIAASFRAALSVSTIIKRSMSCWSVTRLGRGSMTHKQQGKCPGKVHPQQDIVAVITHRSCIMLNSL